MDRLVPAGRRRPLNSLRSLSVVALVAATALPLAWSTHAPAGAISSSGIQFPVVWTCETLPGRSAASYVRFEIGLPRGSRPGGQEIRVLENRGRVLDAKAFPLAVEPVAVATTSRAPVTRYSDAVGSARVDIHVPPQADLFETVHIGHASFETPIAKESFVAFVACRAASDRGSVPDVGQNAE